MSVYLHDIPLDQALARFKEALADAGLSGILGEEELPLTVDLIGRVLSRPVWAKISSPHYHASAMDGYAVRAVDTHGARQTAPVALKVGPQAKYLDTGDLLPEGFNAVIQIEHVEALDASGEITGEIRNPDLIRIRESAKPWQHIRPLGEDMIATQLVLPAGQIIRPVDLGAIAGSGHSSVFISRKPKVAVIPTGTELVEIGSPVMPGDILEYNSLVLSSQVELWGGISDKRPIVADLLKSIRSAVAEAAAENDLVLLNAGSSAGAVIFYLKKNK